MTAPPLRAPATALGRWRMPRPVAELARVHRQHCRRADLRLLREAYQAADHAHQGQTRDSGTPFISHPVAVARIIAELGMDTQTVAAALLHDTVEDTRYTLSHLRTQFGPPVAELVDGVTKFEKVHFGPVAEAETFRKMIIAASRDIRVLVIKVADRLHNMRTLRHKPRHSQVRTATVTRDIIIPFADRLGLYTLRRELEDLVLSTLEPDQYRHIQDHIARTSADRQANVTAARRQLAPALRRAGIRARTHDRPRHHYSIHRELIKHPQLPGAHNPPRLIVVVNGNEQACYETVGIVHQTWQPVPGRFRDLIATPKYNLYQSLHTTVLGPGDEPMEVLIRTRDMHQTAELGIAADLARHGPQAVQPQWLQRLLAWQREATDPDQFLTSLRTDLANDEITIVCHSRTATVPAGSTCIDLAYQLDPATADRLIAARVNGKLIPLSLRLRDGDLIELLHAHTDTPAGLSSDWLGSAHTPLARLQIQAAFGQEQRAVGDEIRTGRIALAAALHRRDRALPTDDTLNAFAAQEGLPDTDALFYAIDHGRLNADRVADQLLASVDHQPAVDASPPAPAVPARRPGAIGHQLNDRR